MEEPQRESHLFAAVHPSFLTHFFERSENKPLFSSRVGVKTGPSTSTTIYLLWAKLLQPLICDRHQNRESERESLNSAGACRPTAALPLSSLAPSMHTSPFLFDALFSFPLSEAHFSRFSLPVSLPVSALFPALVGDNILQHSIRPLTLQHPVAKLPC